MVVDLLRRIASVRYIGWANLIEAVRYGLLRQRVERDLPAPPSGDGTAPGRLEGVEATESGLRLRFDRAELEVVFLAADLVRLTWTPGRLPLPYGREEGVEWAGAAPRIEESDDAVRLTTPDLIVSVQRDGAVTLSDGTGAVLRRDRPPTLTGERWRLTTALRPEEVAFGLGERSAPTNVRPGRYRLWNREPKGRYGPTTDPVYLCVPVWLSRHARGSYLVFYENTHDGEVVFDDDVGVRFEGGALRYYLTPGPAPRALDRFTRLTGRPVLPPRWSLGFHQCRWSYETEDEVRKLVAGFEEHDLPLDAVHLDIHYMDGYRVFTVDPRRFPDLGALADDLEAKGVRLVCILDPGVKRDPDYALYREGTERGVFLRLPDGSELAAPVWPGSCAFPDFTDPEARRFWGEQYDGLVDAGVDGIWHDMNEPAAFSAWGDPTLPRNTPHSCEGRGGDHVEAHNVYAHQEARAAFEALRTLRPDRRPWLLSRSGWVGLQRYAWTWTGDSESNWWSLRQSVRIALSLGLVGMPWTGPDIGGFGGSPSPELFARWFQLGALLPFFRVHSAAFAPRREPWLFGERVLGIVREHLRLRARLLPYLYTCAWETSQTGAPLVRPLGWPDDDDVDLWTADDAFRLGDALIVAPIVQEGATSRALRLPEGRWYALDDDTSYDGPGEVRLEAPLERIPILVRAGAVLPMAEGGETVLHVWPPAVGDGGGLRYHDAGDGYGPCAVERYRVASSDQGLSLSRVTEGELETGPLRCVAHAGEEVTWVDC